MVWVELAESTSEHISLVGQWRSDPESVQASLHTALSWDHFRSRYAQIASLPPFFLRSDMQRVAFVYFRPHRGSVEVSVIVAPDCRGRGYGSCALEVAERRAVEAGVGELVAYIRPENRASKALFEKAGYKAEGTADYPLCDLSESVEVLVYRRFLKPLSERVCVIAEIGSNWMVGDRMETARELIEKAASAGVDAVKFQTFKASTLYAPHAGKSDYLGDSRDINEILRDLEMGYEQIPALAKMAREAGVEFMSSAFSVEDCKAIDPYVKRHKVASYENAYTPLLEYVAQTGKPILLSTGASYMAEIAYALSVLQGSGPVTLLQCAAAYPAEPASLHLRAMQTLHQAFGLEVGLSDHSLDPVMAPVMAVALGAKVVEKHYTLSRSLPGPDHAFSVEPDELAELVSRVRLAEQMRGDLEKRVCEQEKELFYFAKRACQATASIAKGEVIGGNIALLRPGKNRKGSHPCCLEALLGKRAVRDIASGEGICMEDVR